MTVFMIVVILAFIASMILLPLVSTQIEQVFSDFIIENTALSGLNKSGELTLFWVITISGVVLLFLLWKLFPAKKEEAPPEYMTGLEAMRSYIPCFVHFCRFLSIFSFSERYAFLFFS